MSTITSSRCLNACRLVISSQYPSLCHFSSFLTSFLPTNTLCRYRIYQYGLGPSCRSTLGIWYSRRAIRFPFDGSARIGSPGSIAHPLACCFSGLCSLRLILLFCLTQRSLVTQLLQLLRLTRRTCGLMASPCRPGAQVEQVAQVNSINFSSCHKTTGRKSPVLPVLPVTQMGGRSALNCIPA